KRTIAVIQPRRITSIHGIIAAIAEEVHVAGVKAGRIGLEEAAEAGIIHPVTVIVEAYFAEPLPAGIQIAVPDRGLASLVLSPIHYRRLSKSVVGVFIDHVPLLAEKGSSPTL